MSARRPEIDNLIAHLQGYVHDLDRTAVDNRRACWSLILRARKRTDDPEGGIKRLIDTVFSGHPSMKFHAKNLTSFRYLLNNATRITNDIRAARAASPAEKSREGHDIISSLYGGAKHDHPAGH